MTLPMLLLLERVEPAERKRIEGLIKDWEPAHFLQVVDLLRIHGVFDDARQAVHQYLETARQTLNVLPESESRRALFFLAQYLGQQTDALERAT
jgi:geranylgeranyl pyrophosphate synthase